MIDLMRRVDPAASVEIDRTSLRARVDQKIGLSPSLEPGPARPRPLIAALVSFAAVAAAVALVATAMSALRSQPLFPLVVGSQQLGGIPGVTQVVKLETGGVKGMAVEGDSIWVLEALHHKLNRVEAETGLIEASYPIDAYAEGLAIGGGYLWLSSYDNGGEILRFDPAAGAVDLTIPLGGAPDGAVWFGDRLWAGNENGELINIARGGQVVQAGTGHLRGEALGYLWVSDSETGDMASIAADGTRGEMVVPIGRAIRAVTGAGRMLWLMDGDYPWGTELSVFDPASGEVRPMASLTFGLHSMVEFEGSLWLTSHTDHLLIRVDPSTGELTRYPLAGKAGGLVVADDSLWVALHHPGAVIEVDPEGGLIEAAEVTHDGWDRFPHRLLCTGPGGEGPTVLIEPYEWIDYGSWSVVQAELSSRGYQVCANGYVDLDVTPDERAADLEEALTEAGIDGPYVLVAAGDGVHALRIFADGRDDIAGVVLADPMPVGFPTFLDQELGDGGHPPWTDLAPDLSERLSGFGDTPVVIIGQDPEAVFRSSRFVEAFGESTSETINQFWQDGLAFYAGLSTDSQRVTAPDTGLEMLIWDHPQLVINEISKVLGWTEP